MQAINNSNDLNIIIEEFKAFMGIKYMPNIDFVYRSVGDLDLNKKINSLAQYEFENKKHIIYLLNDFKSSNFYKSIIFHELTHCLDTYLYQDEFEIGFLKWYKEYHAGQVELLKSLGVKSIQDNVDFEMNTQVDTLLEFKTVRSILQSYLEDLNSIIGELNLNNATEILNMLFIYLGKKSICSMYAADFNENDLDERNLIKSSIGYLFPAINKIFIGFMEPDAIKKSQNLAKLFYAKLIS